MIAYNPSTTPRLVGTTATHTCNPGFRRGTEETIFIRNCQSNGQWDISNRNCVGTFLQYCVIAVYRIACYKNSQILKFNSSYFSTPIMTKCTMWAKKGWGWNLRLQTACCADIVANKDYSARLLFTGYSFSVDLLWLLKFEIGERSFFRRSIYSSTSLFFAAIPLVSSE